MWKLSNGGCGQGVKAMDCGSIIRGFESRHSPLTDNKIRINSVRFLVFVLFSKRLIYFSTFLLLILSIFAISLFIKPFTSKWVILFSLEVKLKVVWFNKIDISRTLAFYWHSYSRSTLYVCASTVYKCIIGFWYRFQSYNLK